MASDLTTSYAQYRRDGFSRVSQLVTREQVHSLMRKVHAVFRRRLETAKLAYELGPDDLLTSASLYRLFEQDRGGYIGCMKAIQNLPEVFTIGTSAPMLECVRELGLREPAFSTKPI